MGPFEVLILVVVLFFVFIALVRKYNNELGVTTIAFAAIFIVTEFGIVYLPRFLDAIASRFNIDSYTPRTEQHIVAITLSIFFILVIFAGYAGRTLAFQGKPATGFAGAVYSILVGLLNGYLVAGTLWWLQDVNDYPVADTPLLKLPLTPWAEAAANYLPPYVVPAIGWAALTALMLLLRIRK